MADLTIRWEHDIPLASEHRFTSPSTPNTLALTQLIDDVLILDAGDVVTLWDGSASPLPSFDFFYADTIDGEVDIEFTCTSATSPGTRTFVMRISDSELPFQLSSQVSNFGFSDTNIGLISLIRARALDTNTDDARLRYAVGRA